ncbi:MAG: response regulator transcription factor [Acholeplasmataceae bacterium]|nr:response regulator transcription factor [Acholeplasmataceae bacterium]
MHNILVLADDRAPFIEVIDHFRKDFFSVYIKPLSYLKNNIDDLNGFDFILLSLAEHESENFSMIQTIKENSICPLYIFSKNSDDEDKSRYLEYGAEGHITIPFNSKIMTSRIKSVLRFINKLKHVKQNIIKIGKLVISMDNREIIYDGVQIPLTNVEYKILKILAEHKNSVVSKDKIIHYVWDEDSSATDNALGIHITRLRKKVKCSRSQIIETVWGLGYRLNHRLCEEETKLND